MSHNSKLVYRSLKKFDESLPDYLDRLSFFNGFASVNNFIIFLELVFFDLYGEVSVADMEGYDKFSGRYRGYGKKLVKCSVALEVLVKRNVSTENMNLTEWNLSSYFKPRRICELCWRESAYYRYYWRFWSYRDCHKHGVTLIFVDVINYAEMFQIRAIDYPKDARFFNEKIYRPLGELIPFCEKREFGFAELDEISMHLLWEKKAWMLIWKILYKQFNISSTFNFYEVPKWTEELDARASEKRIRKALSKFAHRKNKEIVEIVALIVFSFVGDVFEKNISFKKWILSRAYTYSPLLYSCLHGINCEAFHNHVEGNEMLPPVDFKKLSPFQIAEFVKCSSILSEVQEERLKANLDGFGGVQWDGSHPEFGGYITFASKGLGFCRARRCYSSGCREASKTSEKFVV